MNENDGQPGGDSIGDAAAATCVPLAELTDAQIDAAPFRILEILTARVEGWAWEQDAATGDVVLSSPDGPHWRQWHSVKPKRTAPREWLRRVADRARPRYLRDGDGTLMLLDWAAQSRHDVTLYVYGDEHPGARRRYVARCYWLGSLATADSESCGTAPGLALCRAIVKAAARAARATPGAEAEGGDS